MLETIITELAPAVLSVVAVLISMLKGKAKKVKTAEEIEKIAEAKKQKLVAKLNRRNKIKPIENNMVEITSTTTEVNEQAEKKMISYEDYLKEKLGE